MELRLLEYFLAIVEAGSLRTAATRLHLSQPSLSAAMMRLETDLGVELLARGPHGSEPTSAGRYLVDVAHRLLGDADDARRTLGRFAAGQRGSLVVASVPALTWHRVPSMLRDLRATSDEIEIELVEAAPWTAVDLLQERAVDVAAMLIADVTAFAHRHRAELRVIDVAAVPLVLAAPPDGALPSSVTLDRLSGRPLLLPRRTALVASLPEAVDRHLSDQRFTPDEIRTTETIQTALALVSAGVGVAIVPDADRVSLRRFDVAVADLTPSPPPLRFVLVVRAETPSGALSRFLDSAGGRVA